MLKTAWLLAGWLSVSVPAGGLIRPVQAQEQRAFPGEKAWHPMIEREGVSFTYLFYQEGDGVHNGVSIMLRNKNTYPVDVRFKVVFRSGEGAEHVEEVARALAPGQATVGGAERLFWIPFKDGQRVVEVGLRGYRVTRRDAPS